jgi:hypothetical protein
MALQKNINLPNSTGGNYIRLGAYRWDRITRECSAHFQLFVSAAAAEAAPKSPICLIGVLRLSGAKFDEYLSNRVLEGEGVTVASQLYLAAKSEPVIAGGELATVDLSDAVNA